MSFLNKVKNMSLKKDISKLDTTNVRQALNNFALKNNTPYPYIDFNLVSTKSFIKINNKQTQIDISKIKQYIDYKTSITQSFTIDIYINKKRKFLIKSKMLLSKNKTRVYIVLLKNSKIPFNLELEENLLNYIDKEKSKYNILVGTQEEDLQTSIKELVELLKINNTLEKDYKLEISNCISYKPSHKGYIQYLYIDKKYHNNLKRSFVYANKGDKLLEIFLGSTGSIGFNCLGEIKTPQHIKPLDVSHINISDNIIQDTKNNTIIASAGISGMVSFDGFSFDITKELTLNNVNNKNCIYFDAPMNDESIVLNIQNLQHDKDAVNANTTLKAHTIIINGDIGSNVVLKASTVKISGTTHKNSKIYAKEVYVNTAKGYVEADYMEIMNLEHGYLQGGEVRLNNAIGGNICGQSVAITRVNNYSIIKASKSIVITSLFGRYNDLFITPLANKNVKDKILRLQKDIKNYKNKYTIKQIHNLKQRFDLYKKKQTIINSKLQSITDNKQEALSLKKILYLISTRTKHIQKIFALRKIHKENIEKLAKYDNDILNASIVLHDSWKKYNFISFNKISTKQKATIEPKGTYGKICLKSQNINDKVLVMGEK